MQSQYTLPDVARFWSKVNKDGPVPPLYPELGPCWLWTRATTGRGYGQFGVLARDRTRSAHRVSWELNRGEIPAGLSVLHRCDRPTCVNPAHLFLGTQADNMRDCAQKGRNGVYAHPERLRRGEAHGRAKLTDDDVRSIRQQHAAGIRTATLARRYKMGESTIFGIVRRLTWRHID